MAEKCENCHGSQNHESRIAVPQIDKRALEYRPTDSLIPYARNARTL